MQEAAPAARHATGMQRAMLLASMRGSTPPPYHLQIAVELAPAVDPAALRTAWRRTLECHESLRSRFRFDGPALVQSMDGPDMSPWRTLPPGDVDSVLKEELKRPFDVNGGECLWRVALIPIDGGRHVWGLTWHHAIVDWSSYGLVLPLLFSLLGGDAAPDAVPGYSSFLAWHHGQDWSVAEPFWRERFRGIAGPSAVVAVHDSPESDSPGASTRRFPVEIDDRTNTRLRELASREDVTLNTIVLAAWALWLARSNDETHAVMGAMRACRKSGPPGADRIVGPLLNTVPFCVAVPESATIAEFLREVRREWVALRDVEHCPLDRVRAWSGFDADTPLFTSAVNFQRKPLAQLFDDWGLTPLARLRHVRRSNAMPLVVSGFEHPSLQVEIVCQTDVVDTRHARRAARSLSALLSQFADDSSAPLSGLSLMDDAELEAVRRCSTGPDATIREGARAHRLFEAVAERIPDARALVAATRTWTYADVDRESSIVASQLRRARVDSGVVGVVMRPSPEIVLAMLGIMKAGAAFFLLNPDLPPDRRRRMLDDADVVCVVSDGTSDEAPAGATVHNIQDLLRPCDGDVFQAKAPCDDRAYLVHTSGSTGESKFVQIEHRSLAVFLESIVAIYGLTPNDRRLQRAQPGTDFFVAEILANLSAGSAVVFHESSQVLGIAEFLRLLDSHGITVTGMPSSYWHEWVRSLGTAAAPLLPARLRLVITGMEKVEFEAVQRWREAFGDSVRWLNVYGPSETTIVSTVFDLASGMPPGLRQVPIGKPVPGTQVLVLDRASRLLPIGMAGELCIAGTGVMRGYWIDHHGDDSCLVANPHAESPEHARLYRTGDFGFQLADGNFVFLGRRDNQVKIRGHRVELETVESALSEAVGGANVVAVVADSGATKSLVAFVEAEDGLDESELQSHLRGRLSAAMVPARIIAQPRLPRLPNGKIDRRAVQRSAADLATTAAPIAPIPGNSSDPEGIIVSVFRAVLQRPDLSPTDDFFQSGGDSLAAVRALAGIEEALDWHPPLGELYAAGSARRLAAKFRLQSTRGAVHCAPLAGGVDTDAEHHVLLVPPAIGFCAPYQLLGKYWKSPQPLWLLEQKPPDLDPAVRTIEHLAAGYAKSIRETLAGRRVSLFGYSSGGLLAWEIARLLAGTDVTVENVIMLEPTTWTRREDGTPVSLKSRRVPRRMAQRLRLLSWCIMQVPSRGRPSYCARLLARSWRRRFGRHVRDEAWDQLQLQWKNFQRAVSRAYDVPFLDARVHLVRGFDALESPDSTRCEQHWASRCREFHSHATFGNHQQLLLDPESQLVALLIARIVRG